MTKPTKNSTQSLLLYENNFDKEFDIIRSVEEEYYVKTKIIFEIISNRIVVVIFDYVKLHFVTSVEEQSVRDSSVTLLITESSIITAIQ